MQPFSYDGAGYFKHEMIDYNPTSSEKHIVFSIDTTFAANGGMSAAIFWMYNMLTKE